MWTCRLKSAEQTWLLGRCIGQLAEPGTVLALSGDLGAGKTCLARGVGAGLGVSEPVTSPSFTILAIHEGGRLPLYHADLYRLGDSEELRELGLDEDWAGAGLSVVEWAERFPELLPVDHLALTMTYLGPDERALTASAGGPRAQRLLAGIRA